MFTSSPFDFARVRRLRQALALCGLAALAAVPSMTVAQVAPDPGRTMYPTLADAGEGSWTPGEEVPVQGSGGYIVDANGAADVSTRSFALWFDGVAADPLECSNRICGASVGVPPGAAPGRHVIAVEGGSQVVIDVAAAPPTPPTPRPVLPVASAPFSPTPGGLGDVAIPPPPSPSPSRLSETAILKLAGGNGSDTPYRFVTAVGSGAQFRLTNWSIDGNFAPGLDSVTLPGFDVRLHKPQIAASVLVSAARRSDGGLWLTTWSHAVGGVLVKLQTRGYALPSGTIVRYGLAGRRLSTTTGQIVTPVVDGNGATRLVTWQVDALGNIIGRRATDAVAGLVADLQVPPSIAWQQGLEYAVTYHDASGNLAWQYWSVNSGGVPTAQGTSNGSYSISGTTPGNSSAGSRHVALPLTGSGQVVALLPASGATGAPQLLVAEHRKVSADPAAAYGPPYRIARNTDDQSPDAPGVDIGVPPAAGLSFADAVPNYRVSDGLFEAALGPGQGQLAGGLAYGAVQPSAGIGSSTKAMTVHLAVRAAAAGVVSMNDCVELGPGEFGHLPGDLTTQYSVDSGRIGKIVNGTPTLWKEGDRISLRTLLLAGIMVSDGLSMKAVARHVAERAADLDPQFDANHPKPVTFAQLVGGSYAQGYFVSLMQQRSAELGLKDTIYCDVYGRCSSTPQDQNTFWMAAAQDPEFVAITTQPAFTLADVAAERTLCGQNFNIDIFAQATSYKFVKNPQNANTYPGFGGAKGGNATDNLDTGYDGNGKLACNIPRSTVRACLACLIGTATRLDRPLYFAETRTPSNGARHSNGFTMLDYGFKRVFTPDHRADSGGQGGAVGDFALASLDPVLNVSSAIVGGTQLQVCLWNATDGGVTQAACRTRSYPGLQLGSAGRQPGELDMVDVTANQAAGNYLTGARVDGNLRLDLWQVGALPQ